MAMSSTTSWTTTTTPATPTHFNCWRASFDAFRHLKRSDATAARAAATVVAIPAVSSAKPAAVPSPIRSPMTWKTSPAAEA